MPVRKHGAENWRNNFHGLQYAPKNFTGLPGQGVILRPVPLRTGRNQGGKSDWPPLRGVQVHEHLF